MLRKAAGLSNPAFVWCFEPVCELARTLFLAQRSVAFRFRAVEHEKDSLFFSTRQLPGGERGVMQILIRALRH